MAVLEVSEFYLACRNGDIKTATDLIETLPIDSINKIEPNGSTALHAASYYGHTEIVRLLLRRGVHRGKRNKFGLTAFDEAKNDEIRKFLARDQHSNRFGGSINVKHKPEWVVDGQCNPSLWVLPPVWGTSGRYVKDGFIPWLKRTLETDTDKEIMNQYIEKLMEARSNHIELLQQMYTEETIFYKKMNQMLASPNSDVLRETHRGDYWAMIVGVEAITGCENCCPNELPNCLYRKVEIPKDELPKYAVGRDISFPAFTSTTKQRAVTNSFPGNVIFIIELNEKCTITTDTNGSAIHEYNKHYYCKDLSSISAFPGEEEVLWWPWSLFTIVQVYHSWFGPIEIRLRPIHTQIYWDLMDW